jgi:hypothetical protein
MASGWGLRSTVIPWRSNSGPFTLQLACKLKCGSENSSQRIVWGLFRWVSYMCGGQVGRSGA